MAAKFGTLGVTCTFCRQFLSRNALRSTANVSLYRYSSHSYGSLISTSLPDIDTEIENLSLHSARGKAMKKLQDRLKRRVKQMPTPRETRMKDDQDWTAVYPTAATFKWSAVPLPVRMGLPAKRGLPPHKYGNLELLKIPNFLHLTPPAIKKHCAALKEFCTEWPTGLETDEQCEKHFPLEVESSDYMFSSPSIRHPKARITTINVKLSNLELDEHARWKLLQLVGDRYNKETDIITITTDRCPVKKQNYDYAIYLLTVLYHESWATEPWEANITEDDMERFVWDINQSKTNILNTVAKIEHKDDTTKEIGVEEESTILKRPEVEEFKAAVSSLRNEEENNELLDQYKQAVLNIVHKKAVSLQS